MHPKSEVYDQVSRKCPLIYRNTILQLSTPYIDPMHQNSPPLVPHRRWCHLANKLKTYSGLCYLFTSFHLRPPFLHLMYDFGSPIIKRMGEFQTRADGISYRVLSAA